jgi:hypothetical protein
MINIDRVLSRRRNMKKSLGLLGASLSLAMAMAVAPSVQAVTIVTVSPGDMQGWAFAQEVATGNGALVSGPGTPPMGDGSAMLSVDNTGRELLLTNQFAGTRLDELTELRYSNYTEVNSTVFANSLQLDVDYNLTDANTAWQGRLVYEPYQNGTVTPFSWQTWDALQGEWWASGAPGNTTCPQSNPCTMVEVLTAYPDAGVRADVGNIQFKAGGPWTGGFTGYVDALLVGVGGETTTFDFEAVDPLVLPTSKDDCKNGGWADFNNPTFKNQGECVSLVASQGRSAH